MSEFRITNCHVHTFTSSHVPKWYPHPLLTPFKYAPFLAKWLAGFLDIIGQERRADFLHRLYQLSAVGNVFRQEEILEELIPLYPSNTRFVCLPMDMSEMEFGPVKRDIVQQHDELAALAKHPTFGPQVIPFATLVPGKDGAVEEMKRCIEELGFKGLKLYPRLGYPPDHEVLMSEVYPYLEKKGLPIVSHCSRGGAQGRFLPLARADRFTDPMAFAPILKTFPKLRVNLAHFGGLNDWLDYVEYGIDPNDPDARRRNWLASILDMLRSGEYPNLYTDISYTVFNFDDFVPFLKVFLEDDLVRPKVLFGSDFYMTKQKALSERAVSFRLRDALGYDLYCQIAQVNPEVWLGERKAPT